MGLFGTESFSAWIEQEGHLYYREANREYLFPYFAKGGEVVLVPCPSRRVHYFFGWYSDRDLQLSPDERRRIIPRLRQHLWKGEGKRVREFEQPEDGDGSLQFYPDLFEDRARALEILEEAEILPFSDYGSVDLLHSEYGLEVCGIKEEGAVEKVGAAMSAGFPHWHFCGTCFKDCGREEGWKFRIHLFRRRRCGR